MTSAKVTSKGQVTIPLEVRERLGIRAGSRVAFVLTASGVYELRPETGSVRHLKGVLGRPDRPVTLGEMDEAVASAVAERGR